MKNGFNLIFKPQVECFFHSRELHLQNELVMQWWQSTMVLLCLVARLGEFCFVYNLILAIVLATNVVSIFCGYFIYYFVFWHILIWIFSDDIWLLEGTAMMVEKMPDGEECNLLYFSYIQLHGIFMFIGWGVLLQLGMFFARYFRNKDPWWFKMHRALQVMEWPLFLNARILHNFTLKRINPHQGYSDFPGIPFFTHPQTNVPLFVNIFGNIFVLL